MNLEEWRLAVRRVASLPMDELLTQDDDLLVLEVERRVYAKATDSGPESLSAAERKLLLAHWLVLEVGNGGLHQFFFNSAGNDAIETLSALRSMGVSSTVSTYEEALAVFPRSQPARDRSTRIGQLQAMSHPSVKRLEGLDRRIWDAERLRNQELARHIRANRGELRLPPLDYDWARRRLRKSSPQ